VLDAEYREQISLGLIQAKNPRSHRQFCKEIVSEDHTHLLEVGDFSEICQNCDAKLFEKESPRYKKYQQYCRKVTAILRLPKHVSNL
jgi:hypothetical protein